MDLYAYLLDLLGEVGVYVLVCGDDARLDLKPQVGHCLSDIIIQSTGVSSYGKEAKKDRMIKWAETANK